MFDLKRPTATLPLVLVSVLALAGQKPGVSAQSGSPSQSSIAAKIKFEESPASRLPLKTALIPSDVNGAKAAEGKQGAIYGMVYGIKELSSHKLIFVNFAKDYKNSIDVVLLSPDFSKFPDMKQLTGKSVLIRGTFVDYHGKPELVLKSPSQIVMVRK